MNKVKKLKTKYGPVAYFDILGYKAIIKNNEISAVIKLIEDYLDKTPTHLRDHVKNIFVPLRLSNRRLEQIGRHTTRIVLSDSIFLIAKQPRSAICSEDRLMGWFLFLVECRYFLQWMFENGLQ